MALNQGEEDCTSAVVASEKGVVVGRLQFEEDGDPIDCQRMGIGGKAIPSNTDKVGHLRWLTLPVQRRSLWHKLQCLTKVWAQPLWPGVGWMLSRGQQGTPPENLAAASSPRGHQQLMCPLAGAGDQE